MGPPRQNTSEADIQAFLARGGRIERPKPPRDSEAAARGLPVYPSQRRGSDYV